LVRKDGFSTMVSDITTTLESEPTPDSPPVSIVTSCFNAVAHFPELLSSIQHQTFRDFELVLVDDGSSDHTLEFIRSSARDDPRIRVIAKEHTGLTDSLRIGVRAARGRWIARWDVDDLADPTRLEVQYRYCVENPDVALVGSDCIEVDQSVGPSRLHRYPREHKNLLNRIQRLRGVFPHSAAFFSRRLALAAGNYRKRFTYSQDWDLWIRLSEVGRIASIPLPLVTIVRRVDSISARNAIQQKLFAVASTICYFLRSQKRSDPSELSDELWLEFCQWLSLRLSRMGVFRNSEAWNAVRSSFLDGRLPGPVRAARALCTAVSKPRSVLALHGRFDGGIAGRLAAEWARTHAQV